jgi:hypothetical protein
VGLAAAGAGAKWALLLHSAPAGAAVGEGVVDQRSSQ